MHSFAAITFDNIFAGLIGAAIGASSAWFLAWRQSVSTAKSRLRALLLSLGHELYFHSPPEDPMIIDKVYRDILSATFDLRGRIVPWRRRKLTDLCNTLIGHDPRSRARHCYAPPAHQDAIAAIEQLLLFIGDGSDIYQKEKMQG